MAAPTDFITIEDFSPGIYSTQFDTNGTGQPIGSGPGDGSVAPLGAAETDGTWGCIADTQGALAPLPRGVAADHSIGVRVNGWDTDANGRPGVAYLLDASLGAVEDSVSSLSPAVAVDTASSQAIHYLWAIQENTRTAVHGYTLYPVLIDGYPDDYTRMSFLYRAGDLTHNAVTAKINPLPVGVLVRAQMQDRLYGDTPESNLFFNPRFTAPATIALVYPGRFSVAGNLDSDELAALYLTEGLHPGDPDAPPFTVHTPTMGISGATTGAIILGQIQEAVTRGSASLYSTPAGQVGLRPNRVDLWSAHIRDQGQALAYQATPSSVQHAVFHQGRLVFISEEEAAGTLQVFPGGTAQRSAYWNLLWYSDWLAPLQLWDMVTDTLPADEKGVPIKGAYGAGAVPPGLAGYGDYGGLVASRPYYPLLPGEDNMDTTGCLGTVTNTQLLMVQSEGGGILISGDLDNPTVRRMPGIESTHGAVAHGTQSPLGFVYGSTTGVYAWTGGDSSNDLSPHLDGFFWDHTQGDEREQYAGPRGRFAYWNGMICAPNNYVMDTRGGGWWRLERINDPNPTTPPPAYNIYDVGSDGKLWAFPYRINDSISTACAYTYDRSVLRDSYSWQSRPLPETVDRVVSVQDIEMLVSTSSQSQITVTLTGYRGVSGGGVHPEGAYQAESRTFTLTTPHKAGYYNRPVKVRADVPALNASTIGSFTAESIRVKVEVQSISVGENEYPAPRIHSIKLGIGQRTRAPKAG